MNAAPTNYMKTIKALRLGLGLSLYNAKTIVDNQRNGTLTIPSSEDYGAMEATRARLAFLGMKTEVSCVKAP